MGKLCRLVKTGSSNCPLSPGWASRSGHDFQGHQLKSCRQAPVLLCLPRRHSTGNLRLEKNNKLIRFTMAYDHDNVCKGHCSSHLYAIEINIDYSNQVLLLAVCQVKTI